jgi:hypothetical protein
LGIEGALTNRNENHSNTSNNSFDSLKKFAAWQFKNKQYPQKKWHFLFLSLYGGALHYCIFGGGEGMGWHVLRIQQRIP